MKRKAEEKETSNNRQTSNKRREEKNGQFRERGREGEDRSIALESNLKCQAFLTDAITFVFKLQHVKS